MSATTSFAPKKTGAGLNRGGSAQDYATPRAFIAAVESEFGPLHHDLACTRGNVRCLTGYYYPEFDSLTQPWAKDHPTGNLWLNPPFGNIAPWAEKCALEGRKRRGKIILLTPASVGSNWFAEHVHDVAKVYAIRPRLSFDGINPYPKDLMISIFSRGVPGFDVWRWDEP